MPRQRDPPRPHVSGGLAVTPSAALKVAVVGPTHPYKGGVAAHTTSLAHELAEAGHDVTLVSWSHLYPSKLYPGEQAVPGGAPDVEPFPRTVRALSWARPDTWVRTGRRLRGFDVLVVVHVIPAVVPAHLALLRAAGAGRRSLQRGRARSGPRTVVIAHNVLPHESHPGDRELMQQFLARVDSVLVHSDSQARIAYELGAPRVSVTDLPPHLPGGAPVERVDHDGPPRLLALGIVRDYKGVDLLMEALADVPGPTLTVAGEMWGSSGERVKELAQDPRLRDRVEVHGGYVPADRLAPLLASHDVLALTYRSATASQNALLGQQHGLPVLASDVGTFAAQVRDGVDGILVPPGDKAALVAALQRLAEPGITDQLRAQVRPPDLSGPWARYVGAIEALAAVEAAAEPDDLDADDTGAATGAAAVAGHLRHRVTSAVRAVVAATRPEVELGRGDIPEWVRASDILSDGQDADDAKALARSLGLPRCSDGIAAWAALGALAAIVRVRDDGRRSAVIVDESGSRSPLSRWARAIGFAPVELELTGHRSSVEVLDVDTASLDVIVRLHPGGCDADDIDEAMSQASWALKSGGLLCVTLPIGHPGAEGALGTADVRAVLARSHDFGFVLVGDLDGDITGRMRSASDTSTRTDAAYGLLRLTLRRR
ncbi:glycosyltransferase involved in cell wall biosynthesis [Phycicoccus badiiscoriae]|uniref:Glycosyltransferase involved in cell wall biosynthesis n=1 Tax=Pedococcus badiiscoriae TaxID=642776 RepID=A0A852WQS8_9MICO|nr:glycosyltransferase involved in cell wall biosynthesis [Pedococcus badiiscoriae]